MNHEDETVVSTEITSFVLAAAAAAIYFLVPGVWPLKARHGAQSGWNFIGPYWTNSWPNCEEHVLMIYRGKYWNCSWFQWRKTYDWDWPNAACSGCQWYSWALDNRFTRFHPFFFMRFPSSHIHPTWVIIATGIHAFFVNPAKLCPGFAGGGTSFRHGSTHDLVNLVGLFLLPSVIQCKFIWLKTYKTITIFDE